MSFIESEFKGYLACSNMNKNFLYALSCTKCQKFNLLQCFNDMHKPLTKCQNQHHPYDKDYVVFDILSLYVENL